MLFSEDLSGSSEMSTLSLDQPANPPVLLSEGKTKI